jgi:putative oxidoreductase
MESYGPVVLRLGVGAMFVAHGAQKLFGALGGGGLSGTAAYLESIGLSPGFALAVVVAITEFVGGLLLVAGTFTRSASLALVVATLGAVWYVQLPNGYFLNWTVTPGRGHGVEYSIVIIAALLCLSATGPGDFSFDEWRARSTEAHAAHRARLRRKF